MGEVGVDIPSSSFCTEDKEEGVEEEEEEPRSPESISTVCMVKAASMAKR